MILQMEQFQQPMHHLQVLVQVIVVLGHIHFLVIKLAILL